MRQNQIYKRDRWWKRERERERESLLCECTTRISSSSARLFIKKISWHVTKEYLHSSRASIKEKGIATKQQMQSSLTKSTSSFLTSSRRHFSRTSSSFSRHKQQQQQQHKRKSSFVTKAGAEEEELMQKLMAMIGGGAPAGRPPKGQMIAKESAIKGRDSEMRVTEEHYVLVRWFRSMFVVVVTLRFRPKMLDFSLSFAFAMS